MLAYFAASRELALVFCVGTTLPENIFLFLSRRLAIIPASSPCSLFFGSRLYPIRSCCGRPAGFPAKIVYPFLSAHTFPKMMPLSSSLFRPYGHLFHQFPRRFFSSAQRGDYSLMLPRHFSSTASSVTKPPQKTDAPAKHDEHDSHHGTNNFYHMPSHHSPSRHHLNPDGTMRDLTTAETFHWEHAEAETPAQQIVSVNGRKMVKGVETRDLVELFLVHQKNIPFWPRMRMNVWGNHDLLMKAEFLFFWTPTFITWSLAIPMFTLLYMLDEAVYAAMTVKVIGRQWYWIYEVESPVDDEE
ncbi:putative mitochondrial cytochrome c oxidase subunit 2a [Toxoplasma gondii TgCatPRC2]|uniref:Cytochrome C oxidase subunit IIa, putative n=6 Tax=Toxoplasma gondii TaxID=5811 RepID=S8EUP1_TOXGM|nr:cytochrome C oxidase subunit IIa, putative [Toxoplasma gondii ME49]KFG42626.1 putative mitochondrial cytochrome c oxidase subunit 2a [Toxoplasma gondii p89]KFG45312.1 putative mitochondrial cytochrome c oxidase subunit 2a [Toxoplasma gondii GAB2-2007-GAL-DOM2]KYF43299.1 putative mitochondrial cytochrome c oxidase subunit 2a [Toxoplasma gondii ARI]KYK69336.1 putative mitochondrial cytochrome c oxidase subunit 2a [Toxoplasma gondii TgCatPRC2]PIM04097.1 putative cytochrome C oxidase subunit II|eukprot:XP_002366312.1 cytochrome C oxidase subunit IIa, putative [Toxoplasma gondii ME49]